MHLQHQYNQTINQSINETTTLIMIISTMIMILNHRNLNHNHVCHIQIAHHLMHCMHDQ